MEELPESLDGVGMGHSVDISDAKQDTTCTRPDGFYIKAPGGLAVGIVHDVKQEEQGCIAICQPVKQCLFLQLFL